MRVLLAFVASIAMQVASAGAADRQVPASAPTASTDAAAVTGLRGAVQHAAAKAEIHHDAAIVYGPRPYVLVVLVRGIADDKVSGALIAEVSRLTWDTVRGR